MTPRRVTSPYLWLIAAATLACSSALAQPAATDTPNAAPASSPSEKPEQAAQDKDPTEAPDTLILSDTLNYDDVKKESVFTGNVIMTRGLMTLRADKLVMHEDPEGFQYGTATVKPGDLVFVRQENPEKFEVVEAKGLRAEYNGKSDEFEMIGEAVVTKYVCGKPFDTIHGDRVKYNQSTNVYQAFSEPGSTGGKRVRSIAAPSAKSDAAAADCRKKSAKG